MPSVSFALTGLFLRFVLRMDGGDAERGDVPGWVLVTIMTAGLVTAIWTLAKGQLSTILQTALDAVKAP